jgi:type II secretory pathway pseudopilin PulG
MKTSGNSIKLRFNPATYAFTIKEILVVIALIGILAAILIPVLNNTRELAIRSKCASNLRHIGHGIQLYSNANGGNLPVHSVNSSANRPWRTYLASRSDGGAWNLGALYPNYINDAKVFYCPGGSRQWEDMARHWGQKLNLSADVRTGYLYNPYFDNGQIYRTMAEFPPNKVLAMDYLFNDWHGGGWNLLLGGMGVVHLRSEQVATYVQANSDTVSSSWPTFSYVLDLLLREGH